MKRIWLFTLLFLGTMISCEESSDDIIDTSTPQLDLTQLRLDIANTLASDFVPSSLAALADGTESLYTSITTFNADQNVENLNKVKADYVALYFLWQDASVFNFGPFAQLALTSAFNSYPTSVDKIEDNITDGDFNLRSIDNISASGLPALEYLLYQGLDTEVIQAFADVNRQNYIADLAQCLVNKVNEVINMWDTSYANQFTSMNASGTDVGSAISIFVNGLEIHLQRRVRDGKVAIPAGIRSAGVPRPAATEAFRSGLSNDLLVRSISRYIDLFTAEKGIGIHEYLDAIDQPTLADDIVTELTDVLYISNNLTLDIATLADSSDPVLQDLFIEMQQVVTLIKTDMASAIGVSITNQDVDGD